MECMTFCIAIKDEIPPGSYLSGWLTQTSLCLMDGRHHVDGISPRVSQPARWYLIRMIYGQCRMSSGYDVTLGQPDDVTTVAISSGWLIPNADGLGQGGMSSEWVTTVSGSDEDIQNHLQVIWVVYFKFVPLAVVCQRFCIFRCSYTISSQKKFLCLIKIGTKRRMCITVNNGNSCQQRQILG